MYVAIVVVLVPPLYRDEIEWYYANKFEIPITEVGEGGNALQTAVQD